MNRNSNIFSKRNTLKNKKYTRINRLSSLLETTRIYMNDINPAFHQLSVRFAFEIVLGSELKLSTLKSEYFNCIFEHPRDCQSAKFPTKKYLRVSTQFSAENPREKSCLREKINK